MKYYERGIKPMLSHSLLSQLCIGMAVIGLIGCGGSGGGSKPASSSAAAQSSTVVALSSSSSSVDAVSSSSVSSSTATGTGWEMVWSDEFDGSNLDTTKWSHEKNCMGGGNNELQCYTDRADNSFVSDGKLHIVAKKETFSGQAKGDDDPTYNAGDTSVTRQYTSARLRSKNKGDWTYGRMEIRAKLPQGQGIWPAIWMLPTESKYGGWPLSGEIDIMEAVNSNTPNGGNNTHGTLHYGDPWPNNKYTGTNYVPPTNVWEEYHTYSVEWEEGEIRWYVDDKHFATQTKKGWYTGGSDRENAPFDQAFHLILNLAVGGNWPGVPNAQTTLPQEMTVEFVKVYRCAANPTTGKGCATNVDPAIKPLTGHPQVGGEFASPPLFAMYEDSLTAGLAINRYTPAAVAFSEVDDAGRGKVLNIIKTGATGNFYFNLAAGPADLTEWLAEGELVFDYKVNSMAAGASLLVKLDSGWPKVSDVSVTPLTIGAWQTFRIGLADLLDNGNSIENPAGNKANIKVITNIFVVEPSNSMDVSFDNVRLVVE